MKKKISVFALLLSFMLALVPPAPAAAADFISDVSYSDVVDFMYNLGYTSFTPKSPEYGVYVVALYDGKLIVMEHEIKLDEPYLGYYDGFIYFFNKVSGSRTFNYYEFYSPENASLYDNYDCLNKYSGTRYCVQSKSVTYLTYSGSFKAINLNHNNNAVSIIYSDLDIFNVDYNVETSTFERSYENIYLKSNCSSLYSFPLWCNNAGLNSIASSNESPSKIPYSYNSYWHIVRRNAAGQWLLTTIGNSVMSENITDYTLLQLDNGNLGVYSLYAGEDVNGYILNVRQYIYDTDGWKVRTYDSYDVREDDDFIIDLGAGSGFDDYKLLAYTSSDIYSETGLDLVHAASTEYVDVTDTPVVPDEPDDPDSPTPTPTSAPGSGSGSSGGGRPGSGTRPETGGQATGGGGLDFIINLFTMVWTKICSVPMAVDGYSISLQQIIVYSALVSIVGGFIMHFIFGRK